MIDEQTDCHFPSDIHVFGIHQLLYSAQKNNYLHLCGLWQWHFKYSDRVWQSWRLTTTTRAVFNIPCHLIEPLTQNSYLPLSDQTHALYRYHWAGQYTSLPPKGLHLLSEMIFNKVWPQKYRVECSCLDLAYAVKKKKNTLLELRSKSRLPEETAVRFLCQCHILHFILCCLGTKPRCTAPHKPRGCNRMPLWNI